MIKFLDEQERTLPVDARKIAGISDLEGQVVVVRGVAKRDEQGNLTVLANQIHVRPKGTEGEKP